MRAGTLDILLDIESAPEQLDRESGDVQRDCWTLFRQVYARRATASVVERWAGKETVAEGSEAFEVRAREVVGVFPDTHRVRLGARIYELHGIVHTNRRADSALLMCRGRMEREAGNLYA